ncbi:MAG: hypothetical protein ACLS5Y_04455 [Clostridia bacterium]
MLTGQNGILNRASEAKEKTETSNKDEQRKLAQAEALMSTEKLLIKELHYQKDLLQQKLKEKIQLMMD